MLSESHHIPAATRHGGNGVHCSINENFVSRNMTTTGMTETGLNIVDGSGGSVSEVSRETTRTTLGVMAHS